VPEVERVHRTKTELALAMVQGARARGSSHRWIGGDEIYGNNQVFAAALDDLGEVFVMDVAGNLRVWTAQPCPPVAPAATPGLRGRPRVRCQAQPAAEAVKVDALARRHFQTQAREISIRATAKGELRARVWVRQVWLWDGRAPSARARLLVVREEADGTCKYSLSNATADTPWERLAYMQAQRFWIERGFQDAKSELGMAQYEVRGWLGWHHHMALVCLALLFLLEERQRTHSQTPLLSARDIVELLAIYLPRRPRDEAEVLRQMHRRHAARQRDLDRCCRPPRPPDPVTRLPK
jgi:SRSO17 transposase